VNLGGTAIGTGITAPSDYILVATDHLCELTGLPLTRGENLVSETANTDPIVEVSGMLKAHATNLLKITSDLRLLNLLGEVRLQPLQAGSSIMPGKVNPVMMEMTAQVALKVMANDYLMSEGASRAHLQLNEFFPLMAQALLESIDILIAIDERLVTHIDAAQADAERCMRYVIESPTLATILLPRIGYPAATALVKQFVAEKSGKSFISFLEEKYGKEIADSAVDPAQVTMLGFEGGPK
jgi:aspartate ammonia-lyase